MHDLEIARKRLRKKGLALSVTKKSEIILESKAHGISGLLSALQDAKERLKGASVADRVVGKAVALLCVYADIRAIYAITLSRLGKAVLEQHGIYHRWDQLVESILEANMKTLCPFEQLATEISDPALAYQKLESLQRSLLSR